MHLDASVGAYWIAGFGAACSEALDGPAYLFAIHGNEIAGVSGREGAGGGRLVVRGGVVEDGCVAALGCNDLQPRFVGVSAAEYFVGQGGSLFGGGGTSGEMEHPAGEDVGEFDEVGGHGMPVLLHDVDALPDFDPVAGEAAERLVHAGEERDGARVGGFAGLHHKLGEIFRLFIGRHEGPGADFDIENESVEALGEFLAHDTGGDEEGRFDGAGVVAQGVENAVGWDEFRSLADESGAAFFQSQEELVERELGVEAGDGFEFV